MAQEQPASPLALLTYRSVLPVYPKIFVSHALCPVDRQGVGLKRLLESLENYEYIGNKDDWTFLLFRFGTFFMCPPPFMSVAYRTRVMAGLCVEGAN